MKIEHIHKLKLPYQYKIKGINWLLNRLVSIVENILIRKSKIHSCIKPNGNREQEIIISLTTYPLREEKVVWTIKSLLNQDASVNRILLWLAEEQYPGRVIPAKIEQYKQFGLEVKFCDDIMSHKKYYYTMLENPNAIVITVDDDVIYPEDTVKKLIRMHRMFPHAVICNQARLIKMNAYGFLPYAKWPTKLPKNILEPKHQILPIGEGGILYPPKVLDTDVFHKDKLMELALNTDDLWLKIMATKNGTKAMITSKVQRGLCEVLTIKKKGSALNRVNVYGGGNDAVINALTRRYRYDLQKICENDSLIRGKIL